MIDLESFAERAKTSRFYLGLLNKGLSRLIPFNKPHGFKIEAIGDYELTTSVPYRKGNLNHIQGLHACSLATLAEFTTGLLLLLNVNSKQFRLIMKTLKMDYHYQGKMDAFAHFKIDETWLNQKITEPLVAIGEVTVDCEVLVYDREQNHLATGIVTWQLKDWKRVRTKK